MPLGALLVTGPDGPPGREARAPGLIWR